LCCPSPSSPQLPRPAPALAKGCKAQKITWHEGQSLSSLNNGYIMLVVRHDHFGASPSNAYKATKQTHWTTLTVVLQNGTLQVSRYHHGGIPGGTPTNLVVKATLVGIGCGARGSFTITRVVAPSTRPSRQDGERSFPLPSSP